MMDRWQRRGLMVSLALHGLLIAVLVVGPAFRAPDRSLPDLPVIEFVPLRLVDEPDFRGGQPQVQPPPARTEPPSPPVRQEPPRLEPRPTPPERVAERPPAPEPRRVAEPRPEPEVQREPRAAPARRLPEVSTRVVTRPVQPRERGGGSADDSARESAAEVRARQEALRQALSRLQELAGSSTEVGVPGPGGEAYANYAQYVKSVYTRAWLVPPDLDVEDATVTASVTIARDGTVVSARIVRGSGHPAVDASVQRTLDRVRSIGREFPAGATEDRRTFTIIFNLRAKRLTG